VRYKSFGEVQQLDSAALRALLVSGEPPERVWAAWTLGLQRDQTFERELRVTATEEPDAGVRRHLVVVLAGAGEARSVLTMAVYDPDERVRATALQYVARLAAPADPEANELLARVLADGAPPLRLGCIFGLRTDAPAALWNAVDACVSNNDRDLRWAAFETVMRQGKMARAAPELTRVLMNTEPERSTRWSALTLLHERDGASGLLALLDDVALEARVIPEVVEMLHAKDVHLAWPEVERLLACFPNADQRHRVLQLLVVGGEGPARSALLRLFVGVCRDHDQRWAMQQEIRTRLQRALDNNRGPLDESEQALYQALNDHVHATAAMARADPDFYVDLDPDLLPPDFPETLDPSIDPLSFPWFCEEEREVLARLDAVRAH
jgi:HEAT repeat protein